MSENARTRMHIGGIVPPQVLDKLKSLLDGAFGTPAEVAAAVQGGRPILLEGLRGFGDVSAIEGFCREHELAYVLQADALPGQFGAVVRGWRPGVAGVAEFPATDGGVATLSPVELESAIAEGPEGVPRLLERLNLADPARLPPLQSSAPWAELEAQRRYLVRFCAVIDRVTSVQVVAATPEAAAQKAQNWVSGPDFDIGQVDFDQLPDARGTLGQLLSIEEENGEQVRTFSVMHADEALSRAQDLGVLRQAARAYADALDSEDQEGGPRSPDGDDYNRLMSLVGRDTASAVPFVGAEPAVFGALRALQTFVSACGGDPPEFLREAFGMAEDVLFVARSAPLAPGAKVPDVVALVRAGDLHLADLPDVLRTEAVCVAAVERDPATFTSVPGALQPKVAMGVDVLGLVRAGRLHLADLPDVLRTEVVCVAAVERSYLAFEDVPRGLEEQVFQALSDGRRREINVAEEVAARVGGWHLAKVDGHERWWNRRGNPGGWMLGHGVSYETPRDVRLGERLSLSAVAGMVLNEDCTFITDCDGSIQTEGVLSNDVVADLVDAFAGDDCYVVQRGGVPGVLVEIGLQRLLPTELVDKVRRIGAEFPDAAVWVTAGSHVAFGSGDRGAVAVRAFVPEAKVDSDRLAELAAHLREVAGSAPPPAAIRIHSLSPSP
ncbi:MULTISPECIES: hypothetical protein [unclassified Xanthobacter]|uniref:hypothetical protein n=1 Tax=unclassified Xanthobacter TaxID=2623496 RepID=UPI001F17D0D4|nr:MULTISPECIES: hypothetical protein [unclassified Xanthobacter]